MLLFEYNYHDVVLHLLLVSTDVSAAIRINTAHSFLSAFLVAVVFTGGLTLRRKLSLIFLVR